MRTRTWLIIGAVLGLAAVILGFLLLRPPTEGVMEHGRHREAYRAGRRPLPCTEELEDIIEERTAPGRRHAPRYPSDTPPRERLELSNELKSLDPAARVARLNYFLSRRPHPPRSPLLPLALILLGSAVGALCLYLALSRREDSAALHSCPHCGRPVEESWRYCPYCARLIDEPDEETSTRSPADAEHDSDSRDD